MVTMTAPRRTGPRTDVCCPDCGVALAELVPEAGEVSLRVRPATLRPAVLVIAAGRRLLRCRRCQARAFVDPAA